MARKLRLEFPGAVYHVINRGNYRRDVFAAEKTKAAFERCLFQACERSGWLLHAYVVMRNHYHLALETPKGNLVIGMQWLEATFANRFNRLRGEHGHLFQGRYKALLVDGESSLGPLCDYIHLNPVRAGVATVAGLRNLSHSSYWHLWRPEGRPAFLQVGTALREAGGLADTAAGCAAYAAYLDWQAAEGPAGKNKAYANLSQGWALGTEEFKADLVRNYQIAAAARALQPCGAAEVRAMRWREALEVATGRLPASARATPDAAHKSAAWKVAVAAHLKSTTDASNAWLARQLDMGSAAYVSKHVGLLLRNGGPGRKWLEELRKVKGET
jgi:REP element-mobilizing transposase RayT